MLPPNFSEFGSCCLSFECENQRMGIFEEKNCHFIDVDKG